MMEDQKAEKIEVYWADEEQTILHWELDRGWQPKDFILSERYTKVIAQELDHDFVLIVNTNRYPLPRFPLAMFKQALSKPPLNQRAMIVVNIPLFGRKILEVLRDFGMEGASSDRLRHAANLEDAYSLARRLLAGMDG